MANPLSNENELYEKIQKIVKKGDPDVKELLNCMWSLTDHHMGNEVYAIQLNIGTYVTGMNPEPIPVEGGTRVMQNCDKIRKFFEKLKEATKPDEKERKK